MADGLELLVRSIESEGPSPDFVATLREQVAAAETMPADVADDEHVVVMDVRPKAEERMMTTTRWMLVGLAAAAIALIVGFVALTGGDEDSRPVDTISETELSDAEQDLADAFFLNPTSDEWLDLFSPDVALTGDLVPVGGIEPLQILQATEYLIPGYQSPECSGLDSPSDGDVAITCRREYQTPLHVALDLPETMVQTTTLWAIEGSIKRVEVSTFVPTNIGSVSAAYEAWRAAYRPEAPRDILALYAAPSLAELEVLVASNTEATLEWGAYNKRWGCDVQNWMSCGPTAVATSMVQDWRTNQPDRLLEYLGPNAAVSGTVSSVADFEGRIAFERAIRQDSSLASVTCQAEATDADQEGSLIVCSGQVGNLVSRALGMQGTDAEFFRLVVSDEGSIVDFVRVPEPVEFTTQTIDPFVEWLRANRPDDADLMVDAAGDPVTSPEAVELWETHINDYIETL